MRAKQRKKQTRKLKCQRRKMRQRAKETLYPRKPLEQKQGKPEARDAGYELLDYGAPLMSQTVKNLPAMQETRVQSLGQEDPLEKEMATHSSILAWRILWTEDCDRLQCMRSQRVGKD